MVEGAVTLFSSSTAQESSSAADIVHLLRDSTTCCHTASMRTIGAALNSTNSQESTRRKRRGGFCGSAVRVRVQLSGTDPTVAGTLKANGTTDGSAVADAAGAEIVTTANPVGAPGKGRLRSERHTSGRASKEERRVARVCQAERCRAEERAKARCASRTSARS